jgi:hypothetical protein
MATMTKTLRRIGMRETKKHNDPDDGHEVESVEDGSRIEE